MRILIGCDHGRRVVSRRCTPDVACISRALYIYYFRAGAAGLDEARGSSRESERRRTIVTRSIPSFCPGEKQLDCLSRVSRFIHLFFHLFLFFFTSSFRRLHSPRTLFLLSFFVSFSRFAPCFARSPRRDSLHFYRARIRVRAPVIAWIYESRTYGHLPGGLHARTNIDECTKTHAAHEHIRKTHVYSATKRWHTHTHTPFQLTDDA